MQEECGNKRASWAKVIGEKWEAFQRAELLPRAKALLLASEESLQYFEHIIDQQKITS